MRRFLQQNQVSGWLFAKKRTNGWESQSTSDLWGGYTIVPNIYS
jgi:hypothetical protein